MRKVKFLILSSLLATSLFLYTGCGKTESATEKADKIAKETKKFHIVSTTFPQYDWTKEVIGDKIDLYDMTLLLDNGVDLHSYQPTAEDIMKISECDLFLYVGGESDGWVDDILEKAVNKDIKVVNLVETLGEKVKIEETVEGMEPHSHEHTHEDGEHDEDEHDHEDGEHHEDEHDHEDGEHHEDEHDHEEDEHVWLSLKNASLITKEIENALSELDPTNAQSYHENSETYIKQLEDLDKEYQTMVDTAKRKTVLFGDRFPFRYLVDDYHLDYFAAFSGCSAETEASFETITFLANKVDELQLPTICVLENSDQKVANVIKSNSKKKSQDIVAMDSLQSVTKQQVDSGYTYLKAMKQNLENLTKVLN